MEEIHKFIKLFFSRIEDENARIEDVRPADVGNSREIVRQSEKVGEGTYRKYICIEKDNFRELGQTEDMKLSQNRMKIGATCQGLMRYICKGREDPYPIK